MMSWHVAMNGRLAPRAFAMPYLQVHSQSAEPLSTLRRIGFDMAWGLIDKCPTPRWLMAILTVPRQHVPKLFGGVAGVFSTRTVSSIQASPEKTGPDMLDSQEEGCSR
jgi:hypothetical protein